MAPLPPQASPGMGMSFRLPEITGRNSRMQSSHSHMGNSKGDRFTKLKGVLVNNLLKEYHKQTKQQGDQLVYNHAVMEVGKILAHNTRLTEQQLQELQRNFASGVMINVPNRNIHVAHAASKKSAYDAKSAKSLAMSRSLGGDQPPAAPDMLAVQNSVEPKSQGMQTERPDMHSPTHAVADSVAETSMSVEGQSKRQRRVDEWSILVLHNDVQHHEDQRKLREKQAIEKAKTREELQKQMLVKMEQKKKMKEEIVKIARSQQEEYQKWQAEQDRVAQLKQAKILREKEYEAKELQRVQKHKQVVAEKDFKEQQAMLAEFARQIEEEKRAKEAESKAKAAAYQEMLKGNAKELERKKAIKQAEMAENHRLFELQIEMAEKQERMRAQREEERQLKLKKAERMAGEMSSKAAEMEAELDMRVKRAQEQYRVRDQERDREKREKKKQRDEEVSKALAEQIAQRNRQRDAERAELAAVAMQYRSDASALVQAEQAARVARAERKKAVQEDLNKQLALKSAHQSGHRGMSTTELRLNKNLLQKVLDEKTPEENVPNEIVDKIRGSPVIKADPSEAKSMLKTPRELR